MTKILGMGNALVDIMTKLDHDGILDKFSLPKGSMQLIDIEKSDKLLSASKHLEKQLTSGGSAANTIHGLAKLGIETAFMGKVGKDEFGKFFHTDLKNSKINPVLFFSKSHSGRVVALISNDSERTFATHLGAAIELSADDLKSELFNGYNYFHIEGFLVQNHELLHKAVQLAKENNLMVSLDLASYNVVEDNLEFLKTILIKYVDILFANEDEARAFTGKEPEEALEILSELCEIAVVKTGSKGSLIKKGNEKHKIDVIKVESFDTTGAGDLYASGFLFGLSKNYPLKKCGKIGTILAGKVIEILGAKMDDKKWEEVKAMIENID
ncbi:MAG: adenosine kinase [Bacteroidetes bacterium]|nr:adenosine kinase [Bacteroidota bacterium]MCK4637800.1 adenosine kinase [Bacteroidales bacterium]